MLSIYKYEHANEFIKDAWEEKKKANPAFSMRAWARTLGLAEHTPLHLMLNGKRSIPRKYIPGLIKSLKLTAKEGVYLENLIDYNRSKGGDQKMFYAARLKELAPKKTVQFTEVEDFKYLKNPLHITIREMVELKDFKNDSHWIQKKLYYKYTISEIQGAIQRLMDLELLILTPDNKLKRTHKDLTTPPDVVNLAVQEYHKNVMGWATQAVTKQKISQREFNGYAINLKKEDLPKAKQMIREFVKCFANGIEARSGHGEETYQLNLQFFASTK